jgi:DNA-directed RNA polymerase, mitochondrial
MNVKIDDEMNHEGNLMGHLKVIPSDDLFEQQLRLEQGMSELGADRYRSRTSKSVERGAEDTTSYGNTILSRCTESVAAGLQEFLREAESGKPGRRHAAIKYLKQLEGRVAAYLALRGVLASLSREQRIQTLALTIGTMIEDEVRYREVRDSDRNLYNHLRKRAQEKDDYRNKRLTVNFTLNKLEIEWESWPEKAKLHLGMKMIDIIISTIGLVEVSHVQEGPRQTVAYLRATEETRAWINDRNTAAGLLSPVYEPMVVPPVDWTTPTSGGYLTRYVKPVRMVKTSNRNYLEELENIEMDGVYAALNAAQRSAWSVNLYILNVLNHVWDNASTHGSVPSRYDDPLPPKPHDIETNEDARKDWRGRAAKVHRENRERTSKRAQFSYTLTTANKYQLFDQLYFPYQLDFRGRIYAVPQFNPQGPDYMKGLLHFADPKPLDEESAPFLAIHLANCGAFGKIDKAPLEDRVSWVYENEDRIIAAARDPFDDLWWTEADSPYQFLAACNEWAGWVEYGPGFPSRLAVALDGSCSGIQHFSMALHDEVGGAAVNLVEADKPADIYTLVQEQAYARMKADAARTDEQTEEERALWLAARMKKLKEGEELTATFTSIRDLALQWLQFAPGRGTFKRPTMTYGYGSREYGFRDQIMTDTLKPAYRAYQKGEGAWPFEGDGFMASLYMAKVISQAVDQVVVKAAEAMNWLKDTATLVAAEGLPIRWTTPDGFAVLQEYKSKKNSRVDTMIAGSRVVVTLSADLDEVDKRLQAQGISPNYVHSLDGTHLRISVVRAAEEGMAHFALVHDSFGVHAADTPRFFQLLRETLVEMYTKRDVIECFRTEIMEQLDPNKRVKLKETPTKGNLDLTAVLGSAFCFA